MGPGLSAVNVDEIVSLHPFGQGSLQCRSPAYPSLMPLPCWQGGSAHQHGGPGASYDAYVEGSNDTFGDSESRRDRIDTVKQRLLVLLKILVIG